MDQFGGFAKLKEIVRLLAKDRYPDAVSLARSIQLAAEKPGSRSPFRRPVANDNNGASFAALELDTILKHVRFSEKIGMASFHSTSQAYLPGFEPAPQEFSEAAVNAKVLAFLKGRNIGVGDLEAAAASVDFADIDALSEAIRSDRPGAISDLDLKKCVRLLGDCGITLTFSRRKTYALKRGA